MKTIKLFHGMTLQGKVIALVILIIWAINGALGIIGFVVSNQILELTLKIDALFFVMGIILMAVWRMRALPPKEAASWLPNSPKFISGKPFLNTIAFLGYELVFIGFLYFLILFCSVGILM